MLDFEDFSLVEPAFLVTIVCEAKLKDSIVTLLKNLKVPSYTVSEVQGERRLIRQSLPAVGGAELQTETQVESTVETTVEVRTVVHQELSNVILYTLKQNTAGFAVFAYRQKVEALVDD